MVIVQWLHGRILRGLQRMQYFPIYPGNERNERRKREHQVRLVA